MPDAEKAVSRFTTLFYPTVPGVVQYNVSQRMLNFRHIPWMKLVPQNAISRTWRRLFNKNWLLSLKLQNLVSIIESIRSSTCQIRMFALSSFQNLFACSLFLTLGPILSKGDSLTQLIPKWFFHSCNCKKNFVCVPKVPMKYLIRESAILFILNDNACTLGDLLQSARLWFWHRPPI